MEPGENETQPTKPRSQSSEVNTATLVEAKESIDLAHFYFIGGGDEWEVFALASEPVDPEIQKLHQEILQIKSVDDENWTPKIRKLRSRLMEQALQIPSSERTVLKVHRFQLPDSPVLSDNQLTEALREKSDNYQTLKQDYPEFVEDCLFWVGSLPPNLPLPGDYDSPDQRELLNEAAKSSGKNKALFCLQKFVAGKEIEEYFADGGEATPEIREMFTTFADNIKTKGRFLDPTSLLKGNILVDNNGIPHIIDATYTVNFEDPDQKLEKFLARVLGTNREEVNLEHFIKYLSPPQHQTKIK